MPHPRSLIAAVATFAVVLTAALTWPAPQSAEAASSCAIKDRKKRKIGERNVYWDAETKRNCAVTVYAGRLWGKKRETVINLIRCAKKVKKGEYCSKGPNDRNANVSQRGLYRYQAGPVSLKASGRCIFALAIIETGRYAPTQSTAMRFRARFCK